MTAKAGGGDLWGGKEPVGGSSPLTQLPGCPSCLRLRPRLINGSVSLSGGGCLLRLKAAVAPLAPWGGWGQGGWLLSRPLILFQPSGSFFPPPLALSEPGSQRLLRKPGKC